MRETFRAYYRPTDIELVEIWAEGIIVLDTNTLLNFFRYTPGTRDEFLGVLDKLQNSLWIPHHVGLEFHRRRLGVISTTSEAFTKVTETLRKAESDIEATLNAYKHHPSLSKSDLLKEVNYFFGGLAEKLESQQEEHRTRVLLNGDAEQTFQRISDLFSGRVGPALTEEELTSIYEEGETRYENKVPPGYKDKDANNPNQYGDLVIWKEILKLGAAEQKPVIFVTDDTKEDWWWRAGGETQGPRVELVDEYWEKAQQRIHFYEPLRFLEYAKVPTESQVSPESLEEVEEVSSASSRAQRVLQERKRSLEAEQAQLVRRIERRQFESSSPEQRVKLQHELEHLVGEQEALESHLELMREQSELLVRGLAHTDGAERHETYEQVALLKENVAGLEKHLSTLGRRRDDLERQLRRGAPGEHRLHGTWKRRIDDIQDELLDVSLALDELSK